MKVIEKLRVPENYDCRNCKHVILHDNCFWCCVYYSHDKFLEDYKTDFNVTNLIDFNKQFKMVYTDEYRKYWNYNPIQKQNNKRNQFIMCYDYESKK